jgi:lysophospholipase L1-like esterase
MISQDMINKAIEIGKNQAKTAIDFRKKELKKRAQAIAKSAPSASPVKALGIAPTKAAKAFGFSSRGVILAEGDSWFDYPQADILRILEDHHGYDIESVAHKGDRVEEMAYSDGQLDAFLRRIEKILRQGIKPKAMLLSGGGNDIAGDELAMLLNHSESAISGFSNSILQGVIDERLYLAYITILSKITSASTEKTGNPIPILLHGYDYPIPDGRGFMGGWWVLPGPWLEPSYRQKGFAKIKDRISLTKVLIDRFNAMIDRVASLPEFSHVHYIDLRGTLSSGANYKHDWANELHPTGNGFIRITQKFVDVIETLA